MAVTVIAGLSAAGGAFAAAVAAQTAFTLGAFATAFAIGAGLSLVSRALAPKPSLGAQLKGITQTTREPATSRKLVYGQMRVGGQIVFLTHSSTSGYADNKYLHLVIVFATHEIESFEEFWFNDKKVWENGSVLSDWSSCVTIVTKDGTQTTADSTLTAASNKWTSAHILNGMAYAHFKLEWDQDKFPQGVPNITAVLKGKKVYDPRTSSTAFSQNPALCLRDYLLDQKYGLAEDSALIDDTAVTAAANLCDETQESGSDIYSNGQKRYQLNGVVDTGNNIKDNIEQLLSAMGGRLTFSGGKYLIEGSEYKTPTITLDESVVISEIQIQTKQSRRGIYNGVKGIFVSEEKNYKVLDYPAQVSSTYATEDGDPIYLDMPLPFVTNNLQAQLLAKIALLKSRQQTVLSMSVNLTGLKLKVGDTVMVTNTRLGYSSKVFEVIDYSFMNTAGGEMGVQLQLIETASAVYDWTSSDEEDFLSGDELDLYDGRTVNNVTSMSATEIGLRGPDGALSSSVELSWTAPDDAFVEFYNVRYNKNGTTQYFEIETKETRIFLPGLDITSNYDFRVQAQNLIGVRSSGTSITNQALNGDTTAPSVPTAVTLTAGINQITCEWTNPTDIDLAFVEVHVTTTSATPSVSATPTAKVGGEEYIAAGLTGQVTRYFHLRAVDFSGNKSAYTTQTSSTSLLAGSGDIGDDAIGNSQIADDAVDTDQINNGAVDTDQIADDAVDITKIANTLQSTNYSAGSAGWKLTTDGTFEAGDGTFRGALTATSGSIATTVTIGGTAASTVESGAASGATALQNGDDITDGTVGGITITSSSLYQGTGTWANSNTGFYLDNTGKFSLKDKLFFNPSNTKLTVAGNIEADTITVNDSLVVLGPLEAKSLAPGSITREMFSQDALDEIFGSLATSVGGSNGDYKENTGNFTASGGTVTLGTSSDKFDHGTSDVDVEFLVDHFFYTTTNYTTAQAQATLNFEVSADGTFTDLTSATKTHTLQFNEYDLSSYYGYTYLVYYLTGDVTKTFTSGSGNDIADNTDVQFRVRVTGVGTAFTGQTVPFTVEANEGVTGVVSTGGNADTLDNLDSTAFLRSNTNDTFDGDLTITGQLILNGSIDQYNVTDLDVSDKTITVNSGNTQSLSDGAGLIVDRGTAADASILWDETNDEFDFSHNVTAPNLSITNWNTAYTYSQVGHLPLAGGTVTGNVTISGSSIQPFTVGSTSARKYIKIVSSQWPEIRFFNADHELQRLGFAHQNESYYNIDEGDFYIFDPTSSRMRFIMPKDGGSFLRDQQYTIVDTGNLSTTLSGYLTAEADTLDSVTDRGATTTNAISTGAITSTGNVSGAQFRASLGTQSAPAFTFKTDDDTGFYGGGNTVYGVTGGQKRLTLNASGVSAHNDLIVLTGKLKFGTVDVIDSDRNLKGIASFDTDIKVPRDHKLYFQDGNSTTGNRISAGLYPSQGFTGTDTFWIEYAAKGGHNFIVNTDGGSTASENSFDHFTIWQGAVDGRKLFHVTNSNGHVFSRGSFYPSNQTTNYVDSTRISNWNTAYGWGDHSTAGYLTSYTETDTLATVTGRGATTTNAISTGAITSSGQLTLSGNNLAVFGPNSNWSRSLAIGGNANNSTSTRASIGVTNGNLHIDAANGAFGTYLNFYDGTNGVYIGNGVGATAAHFSSSGHLALAGDQGDHVSGYALTVGGVGVLSTGRNLANIAAISSGNVTTTGNFINNTNGGIFLKSNTAEANNWLFKENAQQWGIYYFNTGAQAGATIGGYTTVGAEYFFTSSQSGYGPAMPTGWTGTQSGSYLNIMLSPYRGYIYAGDQIEAKNGYRLNGATVIDSSRNITAGTISSGAITSTGDVEVRSGNKLILQRPNNGVASNISTDSTGAMILDSLNTEGFFFNNNGTNAFKLDPVNATFAGTITSGAVSSSGSYTVPNTSQNGLKSANGNNFFLPLDQYNNMHIRSTTGSEYHDSSAYFFRKVDQTEIFRITGSGVDVRLGTLAVNGTTRIDASGNATLGTITSNGYTVFNSGSQITTAGAITAGDASTALGYYVGANQIIDGNRALKNIVSINVSGDIDVTNGKITAGESGHSSSVGVLELGASLSNGWGTTTKYPYIGSDGSGTSLVMIHNPHVPFRTDNARSGASGRAGLRMARNAAGNWWDMGLIGDEWELYRSGSGRFIGVSNNGSVTLTGTDHNYFKIENLSLAKEQMIRFRNSQTNYWYAGIRTSAGIASTADFHIYSTALGDDAFALTTSGDLVAKRNLNTKTGEIQINGQAVIDASRNVTNVNISRLREDIYAPYLSPTNTNTLNAGYGNAADNSDMWINYRGYNDGFTYFRDFRIGDGKGTPLLFVDGSSKAFDFQSGSFLQIAGTTVIDSVRRFYASNGTSVKAAYSFDGESNTGWYKPAAGEIAFISQGVERLHVKSTGELEIPTGRVNIDGPAAALDALLLGSATQSSYTNAVWYSNSGNAQIWKSGGAYSGFGGTSAMNIYNSNALIAFHPSNTQNVVQIDSGGLNIGASKTLEMNGVTVIDASRNLTNIAGITTESSSSNLVDLSPTVNGQILHRLWNKSTGASARAVMRIANNGNTNQGTRLEFSDQTYYVGTISADRTNGMQFYVGQMNSPLQSLRMTISNAGNMSLEGNLTMNSYDITGVNMLVVDDEARLPSLKIGTITAIDSSRNGIFSGVGINVTPSTGNFGPLGRKAHFHIQDVASTNNATAVIECSDAGESSLYLCETSGTAGYGARLYYEGLGNNFFNIEIVDDAGATKFPTAFTIDRDASVGINKSGPIGRLDVHQTYNAPTMCLTSSNPSTWGPSLLIGNTVADQTLVDGNDRPMIVLDGKFPVLNLNHTVTSNSKHGPTIQFTHEGYNSNRQWVIGTDGQGQRMDFGVSGGTAGTNSDKNPHRGIAGYNGTTIMRLFQNGVLIGSTGAYPNDITSISKALDVRGNVQISGSGGDSDPLLRIEGSASSTFNHVTHMLHPNLAVGEANIAVIGQATGAANSGYIGYYRGGGSGSLDNFMSIGLWSYDHIFRFYPGGDFHARTGNVKKVAYNKAYTLESSGTSSSGSAIGFQQLTGEGWSGIFVDYNPYEGWGLYHDNPSNFFYITAETTAGTLGTSFTVPNRDSGTSTAYAKIRFNQNNGNIDAGGAITAQGNITAYASDRRLKTNFRQIDSAVAKVKQLNGMIFDWNDVADERGFVPDRKHDDIGLIAQEVQQVVPAAVELAPFDTEFISTPITKGDKNGGHIEEKRSISGEDYLTVNYAKLVPLLVNAVREQADEIDELKQLIKEMKNGNH